MSVSVSVCVCVCFCVRAFPLAGTPSPSCACVSVCPSFFLSIQRAMFHTLMCLCTVAVLDVLQAGPIEAPCGSCLVKTNFGGPTNICLEPSVKTLCDTWGEEIRRRHVPAPFPVTFEFVPNNTCETAAFNASDTPNVPEVPTYLRGTCVLKHAGNVLAPEGDIQLFGRSDNLRLFTTLCNSPAVGGEFCPQSAPYPTNCSLTDNATVVGFTEGPSNPSVWVCPYE